MRGAFWGKGVLKQPGSPHQSKEVPVGGGRKPRCSIKGARQHPHTEVGGRGWAGVGVPLVIIRNMFEAVSALRGRWRDRRSRHVNVQVKTAINIIEKQQPVFTSIKHITARLSSHFQGSSTHCIVHSQIHNRLSWGLS